MCFLLQLFMSRKLQFFSFIYHLITFSYANV